jgi:hypothetical protein
LCRSGSSASVTRDDVGELLLEGFPLDVCDSLRRGKGEIVACLIVDKPELEADLSSAFLAAKQSWKEK